MGKNSLITIKGRIEWQCIMIKAFYVSIFLKEADLENTIN